MSRLRVRSKVCIASFHVRRKVCIAPFYVQSKVNKLAPHIAGSNADFAPHLEGSHADFAPHMEQRHSCRDQIIAKFAIFAYFLKYLFYTTYFLGVNRTHVTTYENKNILRASTFKKRGLTVPCIGAWEIWYLLSCVLSVCEPGCQRSLGCSLLFKIYVFLAGWK